MKRTQRIAAVAMALVVAGISLDAQWPQFRGPHGNGSTATDVPVTWSGKAHVAWRPRCTGAPGRRRSCSALMSG